jgi:hypothetical protein
MDFYGNDSFTFCLTGDNLLVPGMRGGAEFRLTECRDFKKNERC